ncbi:4-hydroxy-3-methylbut-2-enyl diphosphate reductase [Candidatus Erwinia haradaeae]|uniref:4-hydroxy-3-methylbut-2-enyl diphosphate reductase n=1 Tax=Candidatus Erwinia haradaeae TaxID=1922217 RepID=A0A451DAJ0_9GAMM|nr:4-hydroxy-3-methylbut-2-enyl diphosphate reductase [Candidatus Erwinia haradaeae]VFP83232.1 4-hydroxy-3-methylbut-2-enyl diphosphate reductase [Candidatus Erwinia haradaeae]
MQIVLANPRGFCAGVHRAINIVERILEIYGAPIFVRHEIVHNNYVVQKLQERGVIFIEEIDQVPERSILVFSAHGVSQVVRKQAMQRNLLMIFDATCPLVTKIHMEVARASRQGIETILIGHSGHPEVEGTMGQYNNEHGGMYLVSTSDDISSLYIKNQNNIRFVTQTTLSVSDSIHVIHALHSRFPQIIGSRKNDICYATTNRQKAVNALTQHADLILVVGSKNSSNSNRLAELAQRLGRRTFLIDSAEDIQEEWLKNIHCVGVTAGASAPNILVQQVTKRLIQLGGICTTELLGHQENMIFDIPKELRR